jgi:hypothetical protein
MASSINEEVRCTNTFPVRRGLEGDVRYFLWERVRGTVGSSARRQVGPHPRVSEHGI